MPNHLEKIKLKFAQLADQAKNLTFRTTEYRAVQYADSAPFYTWYSSALNLLYGVFGKDSPHYDLFQASGEKNRGDSFTKQHVDSCIGIFMGAKSDVDGGYLFDLQTSVSGEVFADFVSLAKAALDDGRHTVAAVLACAALEDALKRYAATKSIDVADKKMDAVINALKAERLVGGAQKGLLDAMPRIRNHAMHAEWDKLTLADAGSVIGFVEQFLLQHFGRSV